MAETFPDQLTDFLPQIRRVVSKIAKEDRVDDLVQECCVRIIAKESLWKEKDKLPQWINAVTKNLTISLLRKKTLPTQTLPLDENVSLPSDKEFSETDIRWVIQQFRFLTPTQKKIMHLKYFEGLKTQEIALQLGISPPAVSQHVSASLLTLKKRARHDGLMAWIFFWDWAGWKKINSGVFMAFNKKIALGAVTCCLISAGVTSVIVQESQMKNLNALKFEKTALETKLLDNREKIKNLEKQLSQASLNASISENSQYPDQQLAQPSADNNSISTIEKNQKDKLDSVKAQTGRPHSHILDIIYAEDQQGDAGSWISSTSAIRNKLIALGPSAVNDLSSLLKQGNYEKGSREAMILVSALLGISESNPDLDIREELKLASKLALGHEDKRTLGKAMVNRQMTEGFDLLFAHWAQNDQLSDRNRFAELVASMTNTPETEPERIIHWVSSLDPSQVRWENGKLISFKPYAAESFKDRSEKFNSAKEKITFGNPLEGASLLYEALAQDDLDASRTEMIDFIRQHTSVDKSKSKEAIIAWFGEHLHDESIWKKPQ